MAVVTPDDKQSRTSRFARSLKRSRLRRFFRVDRSSMRSLIIFGISAAVAGLILVWVIAHWRMSAAVTRLEGAQYGRLAIEAGVRIDELASRDRSRLKEAAFSDELYQTLERGPAPPDSFIRPYFAEWFPRIYGYQFVVLYDLQGHRLFVRSDGEQDLEPTAVTNGLLRVLDNREPAAGFIRNGAQVYWVAGVPVLPTDYRDQAQPI